MAIGAENVTEDFFRENATTFCIDHASRTLSLLCLKNFSGNSSAETPVTGWQPEPHPEMIRTTHACRGLGGGRLHVETASATGFRTSLSFQKWPHSTVLPFSHPQCKQVLPKSDRFALITHHMFSRSLSHPNHRHPKKMLQNEPVISKVGTEEVGFKKGGPGICSRLNLYLTLTLSREDLTNHGFAPLRSHA